MKTKIKTKKATVISVINHKGGVGKTTCTVNLGASLALQGNSVLLIDLDAQMNLTHCFIGLPEEDSQCISDCILNKVAIEDIVLETKTKNLFLAPAGESMMDLDIRLQAELGREQLLKAALKKARKEYDYILIDNPPHISLTTINSLAASDYFFVPVSAEYLPMVGIKSLLTTVTQVKGINPSLKNLGFLLTMVDKREGISADIEKVLRTNFKNEVFNSTIRINTKLKSCPAEQKTIFDVEGKKGKSVVEYNAVCREILKRVRGKSGN
jgi:chromosome partitioning protein